MIIMLCVRKKNDAHVLLKPGFAPDIPSCPLDQKNLCSGHAGNLNVSTDGDVDSGNLYKDLALLWL